VYGIVTQAGGDVHIYSEPGIGTTFNVFLPASDEPLDTVDDEALTVEPARGNGEMVLVVEDEPAIREVTRRILERSGYHVLVAAGGAEALGLAEHHDGRIDLLMTDVVMPRMLGKEVAERLLALRPDAKVLYMSGYARPVLATTGTLDPGVILLEKPFSESALLGAVRQVLDAPAEARSG
jgi:CheY-like chemotaxis protein